MGTAEGMSGKSGGTAYRGDIYALEEDREELASLGIELGPFNERWHCFEHCEVGPEALERLRALGNKYLWVLTPVLGGSERPGEVASPVEREERDECGRKRPTAWVSARPAPRGSVQ